MSPFGLLTLLACEGISLQDWSEPTLTLRTPEAGAMVEGGTVYVSGQTRHLDRVYVNGVEAELNAFGKFELEFPVEPGLTVIEAVGERDDGEIRFDRRALIAGRFGDPEAPVSQAVALRVNQGALDTAMLAVQDALHPHVIEARAMQMNPVLNESTGIAGWNLIEVKAVIQDLGFQEPKLYATPGPDGLELYLRVPALHVSTRCWGNVLDKPFDVWTSVGAEQVEVVPTLDLSAEDGELRVQLVDFDLELVGFRFDTSALPSEIEDMLVVDSVVDRIEGAVEEAVIEGVGPLLEGALAGLDLSFSLPVRGRRLDASLAFDEADVDSEGVLIVAEVATHMPPALDARVPGYLLADDPAAPAPPRKADLGLAVSDDFVNALLFQLWRGGALDMTLSSADGTLGPELLDSLKAEEASLRARAELPPLVGGFGDRLQLQVGELAVDVDTPGGELGDHLELSVDVELDLAPHTQGGELDLDLGAPALTLMVRESDWGATDSATTNLLEAMLPIDQLLGAVDELSIPMPSLGDAGPVEARVLRDPGYTVVGLDL